MSEEMGIMERIARGLKAANRIANSYHYAVVEKAMRKGEWRYR